MTKEFKEDKYQIRTINTLYGKRWAVVEAFKHHPLAKTAKGEFITKGQGKKKQYLTDTVVDYHAVEYKSGNSNNVKLAIFDYDKGGLEAARDLLKSLKKSGK